MTYNIIRNSLVILIAIMAHRHNSIICFNFKISETFWLCRWLCKLNLRTNQMYIIPAPDGTVAKSSANGLVGTGFASWYLLQPRAGF